MAKRGLQRKCGRLTACVRVPPGRRRDNHSRPLVELLLLVQIHSRLVSILQDAVLNVLVNLAAFQDGQRALLKSLALAGLFDLVSS